MAVGNPPDIGQRTATDAAAEGRPPFVDLMLNNFVETTGVAVPDEVRDYILNVVLVPDDRWERGRLAGQLDAEKTALELNNALKHVISRYGNQFPSVDEVNAVFHEYLGEDCWFPLGIC